MFKQHKVLKLAILTVLCLIIIAVPVIAAVSRPEITITTDKSEYTGKDTITAVIDINNVTGNDMNGIVVSGAVPAGYVTDDGVTAPDSWTAELNKVAAGSTESITVQFIKQTSDDDIASNDETSLDDTDEQENVNDEQASDDKDGAAEQEASGDKDAAADQQASDSKDAEVTTGSSTDNNVKTGDDSEPFVFAVLAVLSLAGMILLVRSKKGKRILSICLAVAVAGGTLMVRGSVNIFAAATDMKVGSPEYAEDESDRAIAGKDSNNGGSETVSEETSASLTIDGKETSISVSIDYELVTGSQDLSYDGYTLQWEEQFEGDSLSRDDWNVELHNPGWVNEELQAYVDSDENIYVEDGSLVLQAVKDGDSITSGRVNTMGKHDFKYGIFEAKVKVPAGSGYLPAFWLMPTDESLYGQWPRCGEIDIMEVLGKETNKVYGTLHYGNPHTESQGSTTLTEGDFAEEYHVYAVEWEPGSFKWYVDGMLYYEAHDWFSTTEGLGTVTYPAPYDQQFYVILNLAVGGKWPGSPDENTDFDNQAFKIDYVRVFQKDSYDENVERPEKKPEVLREADETGNYIINGDFSENEALDDTENWILLNADGGEATADIKDRVLRILTTKAGNVDYSVQFVQGGLPAEKGATYRLTFDAWADAERTAIVNVDAVNRGYSRYLSDTKIDLTPTKQSFSFEYTMTGENDGNSRLEFNLGNTDSTATVYIDNVRLEKIAQSDIVDQKTVLSDGNYVYNGKFQEGTGRLVYWDIDNKAGAEISVTNDEEHDRRLKIVAPEGTSADKPVVISQGDLALLANKEYAISYDADGDTGKTIKATLAGESLDAELTGKSQTLSKSVAVGEKVDNRVVFTITAPGTYYIDNVSIVEDKLIKNGKFDAGLSSFETYVDGSASAISIVDSLNEDNAYDITINKTGDAEWKVQLKQGGVRLEEGQWYRLSLDMKSEIDRKVIVAIQRDGSVHKNDQGDEDWTPYVQNTAELTKDYQTYVYEFQMNPSTEPKTDNGAIFNVAMGAVSGEQITKSHRICIDNILLEKIEAPENVIEPKPYDTELITNGNFANGTADWSKLQYPFSNPGSGTIIINEGKAVINISDPGSEDWNVQLITGFNIQLEENEKYVLTYKGKAESAGRIKLAFMTSGYTWYKGVEQDLTNKEQTYTYMFTVDGDNKTTNSEIGLFVSMGSPVNTAATTITLSDFSLMKVKEFPSAPAQDDQEESGEDDSSETEAGENLIKNGDFTDDSDWIKGEYGGSATFTVSDNKMEIKITNSGTDDFMVQLGQGGVKLEGGKKYKVSFKASSTIDRTIVAGVQNASYAQYGQEILSLTEDTNTFEYYVDMSGKDSDDNATLYFSLGKQAEATITLSSVKLELVED